MSKSIAYPDADLSCGLSYDGMLICGSPDSIKRVRDWLHAATGTVPCLRNELMNAREQIAALKPSDAALNDAYAEGRKDEREANADLLAALAEYSRPSNWAADDNGVRRVWLEPDSSTPYAYNGFELAASALAKATGEPQ